MFNKSKSEKDSTPGLFITIEGTDGSGKGTQTELLVNRLKEQGYDVVEFSFPRYDEASSYFVKEYLNGNYGSAEQVGPYTGSLFFALDRYAASFGIKNALDQGKVVLANRFTGSNMAHQGTKFASAEERRGFFIWLDNLEFQMLDIPRPDFNFVLRVPADIAQKLVDEKGERNYTDKKRDIHEADLDHLKKSVEVYDDLCQLFPKDFKTIDCVRNDKLMPVDTINNLLLETIKPLLPEPGKPSKTSKKPEEDNPYVKQLPSGKIITKAGYDYLDKTVTNTKGNVYSFFTSKLDPTTIAAAMARLSRRGDDMRLTILDEFAYQMGKDEQLLNRVITAYGDDSVQQLTGVHMVVENASNLLTKKLEWGRLAAYLEQSTRYIYFDQRDEHGHYRYYVPPELDANTKQDYCAAMDQIFDKYSEVVHKVTEHVRANSSTPAEERDGAWKTATRAQACDAVRGMLPVATTATVGIYASGQALENLIMNLMADELEECRTVGEQLLEQGRKVIPAFLKRADKPERGGATIAYRANTKKTVAKLAKELLPENYGGYRNQPVTLTDIWPRNELDIVPDILYEHTTQPLKSIRQEVAGWDYEKKATVLEAYFGERLNRRHRPGRALEKAHYSWDLICDYGIFRDLQRHRMVDDLEWQLLTPRFGYDIPSLVEEAGLAEEYEDCFDLSLKLYSKLQQSNFGLQAQYATLFGHKMRWKVTYNAREAFHLHELRTSPQGHPGYRQLVLAMHEQLAEKHPIIASGMRFVNQNEDPELTRLAAERASQYKLDQLK